MSAVGRKSPLIFALTCPIVMSAFHPKADIQNVRARGLMSAYGRKQPSVNS